MNILTDRLPDSITLGDKKYPVNTGFKNWVMAGHLAGLQTGRREDILKILFMCYKKRLPPSLSAACRGITDFYSGALAGNETKNGDTEKADDNPFKKHSARLFDFYYDSRHIYSDFMGTYGIDLTRENIHFYKFCALFEGLPESSRTMQIIKIRATDLSDIKSPELKRKVVRLKKIYSLNRYLPKHVKQRELGEALGMFF